MKAVTKDIMKKIDDETSINNPSIELMEMAGKEMYKIILTLNRFFHYLIN